MIKKFLSKEKKYCEGFFANSKGNNYFLGINFSVAKTPIKFSHKGSQILDCINAFDLAEIKEINIGQINMMTVSSFCGPKGKIWGLDACSIKQKVNLDINVKQNNKKIPVYDINHLKNAFKELVGTIESPRFSFLPGSHVPCAVKTISVRGEKIIYSALGLGIPEDRNKNACLLVEDVGYIPKKSDLKKYKKNILENLAKSVLEIGKNQNIKYNEIFAGITDLQIGKNEIGCALVACPYFLLAEKANPAEKNIFKLSLNEWKKINNF